MSLIKSLSGITSAVAAHGSVAWARSLPLWVSVALVALLVWQTTQFVWALLGAGRTPGAGPAAVAPVPVPATPAIDVGAIISAHLFGEVGIQNAGATDPSTVATTELALVLVGTIAHSDPAQGYAILGDSAATAKVYGVGKAITGGRRLHAVYTDRVILDRDGKLEALLLPKKFTGSGTVAAVRQQDLAALDPAAITDILQPQPVFAGGRQRGYRVYPGRNQQQFSRLGLMPGDIVTAVNGTPLDEPALGADALQSINYGTEVTIAIERNGQPTQIVINNAQFILDAAAETPPQELP